MKQYCIYLRKSRADMEAEAHGEGETLARHERALLDLAKHKQLSIGKMYREIVSGDTIAARPIMQQLLSDVEQGIWAGVLVMEVERLARGDTIDQGIVAQTFKYSNTKIITPMKTYDPTNEFDEEYFEFGLFMSRREYKTINRRLQRGRYASAKEGKFVGSIAPYGYRIVKIPNDKGNTLAIVPEKAEIVRLIFSFYTRGEKGEDGEYRRLGIQAIAHKLNEMGIPPIRHDYWQKQTIRDMIINPTYAGMIRWGWRRSIKKMINGKPTKSRPITDDKNCVLVKGLHKPIIPKEEFDLAQKYINEIPPVPVGYRKEIQNPFAGIIVCGVCGRKMVLRKGKVRQDKPQKPDYIVCHCRACWNVSAPFHLVEKHIFDALKQWLDAYKLKLKNHENAPAVEKEQLLAALNAANAEISLLKNQLNKIYDFLERGIYSEDKFWERSASLSERINKSETAKKSLEKSLKKISSKDAVAAFFVPKVEHLLDVYDKLPSAAVKNTMLKEILEKVVYIKRSSGCVNGNSAADFEITLFPRLPDESQPLDTKKAARFF